MPSNFVPVDRPAPHRHCRGLTLIELMVGLAVMALTLAIAAPQFKRWGGSTRVSTQAADLERALAYARSASQLRGVRVTVCRTAAPLATSPGCDASASWSQGWIIFVDNVHVAGNQAGVIDGSDTVLRIGEAVTGNIGTVGNVGAWVAYTPQGLVRTIAGPVNGGFSVCTAPDGRVITLSPVGPVTTVTQACT